MLLVPAIGDARVSAQRTIAREPAVARLPHIKPSGGVAPTQTSNRLQKRMNAFPALTKKGMPYVPVQVSGHSSNARRSKVRLGIK
jgi:hypothetical protein